MADYRKPGFFGQMKQDQQFADQAMSNVFQQELNQSLGFAPGAIVNNPADFIPDPRGTGVPMRRDKPQQNVLPETFGVQTSTGFQIGTDDLALSEADVAGRPHMFYRKPNGNLHAKYVRADGSEATYNPYTKHVTPGGQLLDGGTDPEILRKLEDINQEQTQVSPFTYTRQGGQTQVVANPVYAAIPNTSGPANPTGIVGGVPNFGPSSTATNLQSGPNVPRHPQPFQPVVPVVPQGATTRPGGVKFDAGVPQFDIYAPPTTNQPPASPSISPQWPDSEDIQRGSTEQGGDDYFRQTADQHLKQTRPDLTQEQRDALIEGAIQKTKIWTQEQNEELEAQPSQGPPPPPPGMRASPMGYIPDQPVYNDPRLEGTKQWPIGTHPVYGQTGSYYGSGVTPLAPEHVVPVRMHRFHKAKANCRHLTSRDTDMVRQHLIRQHSKLSKTI